VKNAIKIQTKISKFIFAASCFGFGCILIGGEAQAQQPTDADKMKVSLTGLDLSTSEGVRAAHERVRTAARRVCAKVATSADMSTSLRYITCLDEAMASSVARIAAIARQESAQRLAHSQSTESP